MIRTQKATHLSLPLWSVLQYCKTNTPDSFFLSFFQLDTTVFQIYYENFSMICHQKYLIYPKIYSEVQVSLIFFSFSILRAKNWLVKTRETCFLWNIWYFYARHRVHTEWQLPLSGVVHHDGKIGPAWWRSGVHAHPLSLYLPCITYKVVVYAQSWEECVMFSGKRKKGGGNDNNKW